MQYESATFPFACSNGAGCHTNVTKSEGGDVTTGPFMVNEFPYHENIFSGPYFMLLCILLLHETVDRNGHDIVHARIKLHRYNRNIVVR